MMKLWIYENHIWEQRIEELYERRSSQLWTQLLQLRKECLKIYHACMGFKPLTSAILVQCSANRANKPTGSRSHCKVRKCRLAVDQHTCSSQSCKMLKTQSFHSRGLKPLSTVCLEHMKDLKYLSLGDLGQNEFSPKWSHNLRKYT